MAITITDRGLGGGAGIALARENMNFPTSRLERIGFDGTGLPASQASGFLDPFLFLFLQIPIAAMQTATYNDL